MDREDVKQRWHEYTTELFDDARKLFEVEGMDNGLPINRTQVEAAFTQMKRGKAIGEDGVAVDMVEALNAYGSNVVLLLANKIYDTGLIPSPMQFSTFITIPKKPGARECNKNRTISMISQLGKVELRIYTGGAIWIC